MKKLLFAASLALVAASAPAVAAAGELPRIYLGTWCGKDDVYTKVDGGSCDPNAPIRLSGPFQSLCKPCHDSAKRFVEERGYRPDVGLDGWPLDPNHPANRAR
jgi:hypothetical protein